MRGLLTISLRELLGWAALTGAGCYGLLHADERLWQIAASIGLLSLLAVSVLAVVGEGRRRDWCCGFAVCVWGYGVAASAGGDSTLAELPTTTWLQHLYTQVQPQPIGAWDVSRGMAFPESQFDPPPSPIRRPHPVAFLKLGHLLIATILGLLGGRLAQAAAAP